MSKWIKIDPEKPNTIPFELVWVFTLEGNVEFKDKDEYIELGYASHYMLVNKPNPPKIKN